MKKNLLFGIVLFPYIVLSQIKPSLIDIPVDVFVNNGKTSVEDIFLELNDLKENVESLFDKNELNHDLAVSNSDFNVYWEAFGKQWHWIKFRENESPLLLFVGLNSFTDEREYTEIYDPGKKSANSLYAKPGRLIAYKRHPLTSELILYSHKYPCCRNASHNIYTIRRVNEELIVKDRFFVGRDSGDMTGPFFPDSVKYNGKYNHLEEKTLLRWSPAIVEENAFEQRAHTNAIIHYEKGAIYKVLAEKGDWLFVIMFSGISEERSSVINYVNFKYKGVYGWIAR